MGVKNNSGTKMNSVGNKFYEDKPEKGWFGFGGKPRWKKLNCVLVQKLAAVCAHCAVRRA